MTLSDRLAEWDAVAAQEQDAGWRYVETTIGPYRALLDVARAAANCRKTETDWAQAIIEARADVDAAAAQNIAAVDELDDALERLREVVGEDDDEWYRREVAGFGPDEVIG
jgi:hypothetical protein